MSAILMSGVILPDGTIERAKNIEEECNKENPTILEIVDHIRSIYDEFKH